MHFLGLKVVEVWGSRLAQFLLDEKTVLRFFFADIFAGDAFLHEFE